MDYNHPIEIHHWEYMEAVLPILALFKHTSKYLEADDYPTGSKALRKLWKLRLCVARVHEDTPAAATGLAVKPFCRYLLVKFDELMNDPTLFFQWAFLAFMDPSGTSVIMGTSNALALCACVCTWLPVCCLQCWCH